MKKWMIWIVFLLFPCLPASAGTISSNGQTGPGDSENALAAQVLRILENSPSFHEIEVSAQGDVVTLSGSVDSCTEWMAAGKMVRQIPGVRDVRNRLSYSYQSHRPDWEIAQDVGWRIRYNEEIHPRYLSVSSKDGMVDLFGSVASSKEKQIALHEAWVVSGVRSVNSANLFVRGLESDFYEDMPFHSYNTLTAQTIREKLAENPVVARFRVQVEVDEGTVRLTGIVGNYPAKDAAERAAAGIRGVQNVIDDITVRPTADRSGGEIAADVRKALSQNPYGKDPGIKVRVASNEAYLSGKVNSMFMRRSILKIVSHVPGVFEIRNEMTRSDLAPVLSDTAMEANIRHQLRINPILSGDDVTASVSLGIATLRGAVQNREALSTAEQSARMGGALMIRNELWIDASRNRS